MKSKYKDLLIEKIAGEMEDWRTIREIDYSSESWEVFRQRIKEAVTNIIEGEEFKDLWN